MDMQVMIGAARLSVCHQQARSLGIRSKAAEVYALAANHLAEYERNTHLETITKHAHAEVERAREAVR
jgi:hypothetical protein